MILRGINDGGESYESEDANESLNTHLVEFPGGKQVIGSL